MPDPVAVPDPAHDTTAARQAAVAALRSPDLASVVALVCWGDVVAGRVVAVHVADHAGHAVLTEDDPEGHVVEGRHPLPGTDPMAFTGPGDEAADPSPPHDRNSYPLPWQRLAGFFADPRSPDVAIVHTADHYFPERGGHRGEHGSLDVVQSRAPLLLSGAGVRARGVVADHARVVDVAPTLAWVLGAEPDALVDAAGVPLDGRVRSDLVSRGAARVVGLLWDGAHPGSLLDLAATGDLPNLRRLLDHGLALAGGAVAEFPSLTLVNHTSLLTGVGPGRHGVVGNVYRDRELGGTRVVPNDPATWHRTADLYRPAVRTLFELVAAERPGARTASVNEMTERGAHASTMALVRAALQAGDAADPGAPGSAASRGFREVIASVLPDPRSSSLVTRRWCDDVPDYAFYSAIDLMGLAQAEGLVGDDSGPPDLLWWSSYVTDAAHHHGGPRSEVARDAFRDLDARLGVLLAALDARGLTDSTLVLLTADHGFESAREEARGDWTAALHATLDPLGVPFVDEGPGFLYLGMG